jgi:5-methylcytosine-specific restriction endonuclease McrA
VDHIIPLAKGGQHHPGNLQVISANENVRKGAKVQFANE